MRMKMYINRKNKKCLLCAVILVMLICSAALPGLLRENALAATAEVIEVLLPDQLTIDAVAGKQYDVAIIVSGITNFSGKDIIVQYNNAELQLVDLCSFTKEKLLNIGEIPHLGVTITQANAGEISFTVDKDIPADKAYSGTLNMFRLKALQTGETILTVTDNYAANPPVPTTIAFTQNSYPATVPASGTETITITAQVKDQNGNVMNGYTPTYSLQNPYSGVSVNSSTGVVTVQSSTAVGTATVVASYGSLTSTTATLALTITPPAPTTIAFTQNSYSATIPATGTDTVAIIAQVKDQNGNVMNGCTPTYSLQNPYSGVSVNSTTGVVTVQSSAAVGTATVVASYGSLTNATASLSLTITTPTPTTLTFVQNMYSATIPASGTDTVTIIAHVKDQNGNVMNGCAPTYSLQIPYSGVSVNSSSGVVTIQSSAAVGTATVVASYGSLTSVTATLSVEKSTAYNFTVHLESGESVYSVGETIYLDIMLTGDINYTMAECGIAYDTGLLEFTGYENMGGWIGQVQTQAPNIIYTQIIPNMNVGVGSPCTTPVKLVTLKFTVKNNLPSASVDTDFSFSSLFVAAPASIPTPTTAPGESFNVTLQM